MARIRVSPLFRRHLPDLVAGLAVFAIMVALTGWHVGIAIASDGSVGADMDHNASALLLAGAFAAMAVFNLAFVRHIRRAYTSPRKAACRNPDRRV
jgi:predicted RNA methylase